MKLVVNPPSSTMTNTRLFCHKLDVPYSADKVAIGLPAAKPKAIHALRRPEINATKKPFFILNSLITFSLDESLPISRSFFAPANPQIPIPRKQIIIPVNVQIPEASWKSTIK